MQPFDRFTFWFLLCSHWRSTKYRSTALHFCTVTTAWRWSLLSPPYSSPQFIKIHVYTHTHTQIFKKQRLG